MDDDPERWLRTRYYEPLSATARAAGHTACIRIWHHAPSPEMPDRHPSERDTGVAVSIVKDGMRREAAIDIRWGSPPTYTEALLDGASAYSGTPQEAFALVNEAFARHLGIALTDVATDNAI
jgi:hypothetical protein